MLPELEKRKAALSIEQAAELERRLQGNPGRAGALIQPASRSSPIPLSFAQERIWLHEQLVPGSRVHNRPANIRIRGPLVVAALHQALLHIVQRHESLRTRVTEKDGQFWQQIDNAAAIDLAVTDVSGDADAEERIAQLADELSRTRFDLQKGPLLRAQLVHIAADDYLLLLTFHHFAFDAWSQSILNRELAASYESFANGRMPDLDGLPIQFADFAAWERQPLRVSKLESSRSFWKQALRDPPVLQLPTDFPHSAVPNEEAGHVGIQAPSHVAMALRDLAREEHTTAFTALLAAFMVLLHRYTQQEDMIVGCPTAGRRRVETENLVGVFINMLPLRARLDHGSTFRELIRQIAAGTVNALKHQDVPFQHIVQDVLTNRDASLHPLFQSMFIYESFSLDPRIAAGVTFRPQSVASVAMLVDLSLELMETANGIGGYLCYRTHLWERASVERMAGHFLTILGAAATEPDLKLDALPMLSDGERHQLLAEWNDTAQDYPRDKCVHELFEAQVEKTPDAVAIVADDRQLTYRELNERANRLAHQLQSLGVGPEVTVGVCLHRSVDLVVSILGILKSGGAYVPLDPEYPRQRLEFVLQDAGIQTVITVTDLSVNLPGGLCQIVCVDAKADSLGAPAGDNPPSRSLPENIAYVIYTSGSTGKPKGVLVEHRSVVNLLTSAANLLDLRSGDGLLGFASPTFDISVAEMFLPLCVGGVAVIVDRDIVFDRERFVREVQQRMPRIIQATPATWELIADYDGWSRDDLTIITTGEALPATLARRLLTKCASLWDLYGPTETTIWSTGHRVSTPSNSIGRPIGNTKVFVLDDRRQLAPNGVWGELFVGGDGVARGYLNRPDLTRERFIANPFDRDANGRLYRTGDRVRWRADGTLEFHGRLDHQVKLRGFRIELGEVEAALREHAGVAQCAVVLREDRPDDRRLVAYWVPRDADQGAGLRDFLSNRLPYYMVPSTFVRVTSLPLTPSGKIDRRALPLPDTARFDRETSYVAPRNNVDESLAEIWSQILRIDSIGIHDNFFALGGHSLSATQVVARASSVLTVDLRLRDLFDAPTIAELAERIKTLRTGASDISSGPPVRLDRKMLDRLPPSFAQERMWFLEQLEGEQVAYNVTYAFHVHGSLDIEALRGALEAIVQRHEPLRTTFDMQEVGLAQIIRPADRFDLSFSDVSELAPAEQEAEVATRCRDVSERRFDLARDAMLRASILRRSERRHVLLLVLHHIAWDGWSQQVFWHELEVLYAANRRNETVALAPLPVQYADYAQWQRNELMGDRLNRLVDYWRKQLSGVTQLELPTDRPRPAHLSSQGGRYDFELDDELIRLLQQLSVSEGVSLYMTLLAAFNVLLGAYSGQHDFAVGSPIAARNYAQLETQIGMFVNTLVLRADLAGNPPFREVLARVRDTSLAAYDHQELPFEKLVEELQPERHIDRTPFFQAMFQFSTFPSDGPKLPGLELIRFMPTQQAKFDLEMQLFTYAHGVRGRLIYRSELFEPATIERLCKSYVELLRAILADPDRRVSELPPANESKRYGRLQDPTAHAKIDTAARNRTVRQFIPPQTETERIMADVWRAALEIQRVGIDDNFFELGGHSILAARVCLELEKRLGRRVPIALLFAAPTIRRLAQEVARDRPSRHAVAIIPLQPRGTRTPLLLMPSLTGSPLSWKDLLDELDAEQPVFAVGLAGQQPPWSEHASLHEIASYFVAAILDSQFNRSFHIIGHSFGGMLAYEIACQLHSAGIKLGRLLIIDTGPEQVRRDSRRTHLQKVGRFLSNAPPWFWHFIRHKSLPQKFSDMRRTWRSWRRQIVAAVYRHTIIKELDEAVDTTHIPEEFRKRMETNYKAFKSYCPGPYPGHLVLFRAKMRPLLHGFTHDLNWGDVATGTVEIIVIPGNHASIIEKPNINLLASRLSTLVDTA